MTMVISTATVDDIPQLVPIINKSYTNDGGKGNGWTNQGHLVNGPRLDPRDPVPGELITDNVTATVLKCEESQAPEILGCVKLEVEDNNGKNSDDGNSDNEKVCQLGMLCVSPYSQGKGVGKKLMEASENWAKSKSCNVMEISVVEDRHDLIGYYERHGFIRTGELVPYPENPGIRVALRAGLRMVILKKALL